MVNVCFVNGSLRGKKASSLEFLEDLGRRLSKRYYDKTTLTVRAKVGESYPLDMLKTIADAEAIVFAFPLHNYGLPGALMRLLEDYYQYARDGGRYNKGVKIYAIVNCGYPRAEKTTGEAVRVMKNFCQRLSLNWRFAVCIGTGPVVVMTKKIPFSYRQLKKAYAQIASDIRGQELLENQDYFIKPIIPETIIAMIKRHYEKSGKMYD
jgi:hypothetical protein